MKHDVDIVVVGAGMVGATFAAALVGSGLRVLLADAGPKPVFDPSRAGVRVSAIGRAGARVLDACGAWQRVTAMRAAPYRHMVVWDGHGGELRFDAAEAGLSTLGWIVENDVVTTALHAALADAKVETRFEAGFDGVEFADDGVLVRFGRTRVRAALLVGADGPASKVREAAGITVHRADYGQRAVVATLNTERSHDDTAWQRFLDDGPVALLPLADARVSLVWSAPDAEADRLLALDDDAFRDALTAATDARLGRVTAVSARAAFPLSRLHALEYVKPRCALVGDAAHVVHPLAGQGANLGLLDAAALAEALVDSANEGAPIGAWSALRRYARWRRAHNALVQETLDAIHQVYGGKAGLLRAVAGVGLAAVDAVGPLKRLLVGYATGERGDLPKIAKPRPGFD